MTNKEKAKEIYKDNLYDCEVRGIVQDEQEILFMLEKMAKWKEEQIKSDLRETFGCMIFCQDHSLSKKEHQYIDLDKAQDIIESFFHIKLDEDGE